MKRVYVAGPVGANDPGRIHRVRAAIWAGEQVSSLGMSPFVPHFFHFWDERHPHEYEFWMQHCFVWLEQCESLFLIPGDSPGAAREVAWMVGQGRPVFTDLDELARWSRG